MGLTALRAGGWFRHADAVIAMSPPLTLGLTGRFVAWMRRAPEIFNIQDVFPDAAIASGAIRNRGVIAATAWLERTSYSRADAVTVLSDDLLANVKAKVARKHHPNFLVIPNFVDTDAIRPAERLTPYRTELGIGDEPVVLYAGNIGFSQSLHLMLGAASAFPDVTFLVNGQGPRRPDLERQARGLANVRFGDYVPDERLNELLATGDIHVVPLRAGLARASVPSKTYSILAAAPAGAGGDRPGHRDPHAARAGRRRYRRRARRSGRVRRRLAPPPRRPRLGDAMGERGRAWVQVSASPGAVADAYARLIHRL